MIERQGGPALENSLTADGHRIGVEVLVVGAGPVGLVMACELARRGVSFRIVDGSPQSFRGSRAKGLQPRSLEVLYDLGITNRIVALGRSGLQVRTYRGDEVLGTHGINADAGEASPATPYTRSMIIPQWRLEEELRQRLAELDRVVERPLELTALEQDPDGVTAILRGEADEPQLVRADYVVGCDGAASTVRKQLSVGFLGETDETVRMLVADLELEGLDRDYWHMWPQPDSGVLALCPLPSTETFQIQVNVPAHTASDLGIADIQRLIDTGTGRKDIRVRDLRWQSIWRLNVRMVDSYRRGRVFLAGDAAHVHSPAGGLGMNTGMQDSYNLAWKLSHVLRGAPDALLDTYEEERLPIAADVLGLSGQLISKGTAGILSGGGQPKDTLQLNLNYRYGQLSVGSGMPERAAAGDRAPDSHGRTLDGSKVRLFDLFRGTHITALAFGQISAEAVSRLAQTAAGAVHLYQVVEPGGEPGLPCGWSVLVDEQGFMRLDYAAATDDLVIVRPDGYIGMRVTEPTREAVEQYLEDLLPPTASQMSGANLLPQY